LYAAKTSDKDNEADWELEAACKKKQNTGEKQ